MAAVQAQAHGTWFLFDPQGFDGFLSSKEALRKRQNRAWKPEDKLFSLSSKTSPVVSVYEVEDVCSLLQLHSCILSAL